MQEGLWYRVQASQRFIESRHIQRVQIERTAVSIMCVESGQRLIQVQRWMSHESVPHDLRRQEIRMVLADIAARFQNVVAMRTS